MSERIVIIGGGFYGICLALYFRSLTKNVTLLERQDALFTGASYINQARVHAGFHYPRSFATARRSLDLHQRFIHDFRPAIIDDFTMLYAIARYGSHVPVTRFSSMFSQLGAPFAPADAAQNSLFDDRWIEAVFACHEPAFDAVILRDLLSERLEHARIDLRLQAEVERVNENPDGRLTIRLRGGDHLDADHVFNATYAHLNQIELPGPRGDLPLKNEVTEIALVEPPKALDGLGVTVMDGPFFSIMPFPARDCYSLTHVRFTPQFAWHFAPGELLPQTKTYRARSRWLHMVRDATRYMPCMAETGWKESLFVTKSVLEKNEFDDGRPIFIRRNSVSPNIFSVMGAKIDNIYDLFSELPTLSPRFADGHAGWVFGGDTS